MGKELGGGDLRRGTSLGEKNVTVLTSTSRYTALQHTVKDARPDTHTCTRADTQPAPGLPLFRTLPGSSSARQCCKVILNSF